MKTLQLINKNPLFKGLTHKLLSIMIVFQFICNPLINIGFANDTELPVETIPVEQVAQTSDSDQQALPPPQTTQETQVTTPPDASIVDTSTDNPNDEGSSDVLFMNNNGPVDQSSSTGSNETGSDLATSPILDEQNNVIQNDTGTNQTGDIEQSIAMSDTTVNEQHDNSNKNFSITISDNALGFLRLRAQANTFSEILAEIPVGTTLSVLSIDDNFYLVAYEGKQGWVSRDYVSSSLTYQEEEVTEYTSPIQKLTQTNGKLNPGSVDSYNYISNKTTYCSYITRLNLERISGLGHVNNFSTNNSSISKGDAYSLLNEAITSKSVRKFKNSESSSLTSYLTSLHGSVYDIYAFHNNLESDSLLEKGHRLLVFLGSDDAFYVLDPVINTSSSPKLLSDYLKNDIYNTTFYVSNYAYSLSTSIEDINSTIRKVKNSSDLINYAILGDITASFDNFGQPVRALLKKNFLWETDELKADMPEGLEISTKDGKPFMVSNLLLQQGNEETPSYIIGSSTKFGVEGQHLLFSKPVKLQIQVGNEYEGEYMEVGVKHFGESDYGSLGITNNLNATCNPDGSSSDDDNKIYINNGTASFYTCGASYFVIKRIGTGVITIAQPLSGSSSRNYFPLVAGSGTIDGEIVRLYLSGNGSYSGIAIVDNGSWEFIPSGPLGPGLHTICVQNSNCTSFEILNNANPIATNDIYTTTINTPINVNPLSNDSDADGDPIFISKINGTFVIAGTPYIITGGIVTVSTTGLMTFRPTMSFVGTSTILYTLSDGNGGESVASVSVNTTMPAGALECNKLYATSISNTTSIVRYDPITNTATNETITLDGRTRSSALTLDGTRIYYIDDNNAGGTLEYLDVPSNTTTVTSYVLPAKFQTVSRTFTFPGGSFTYTVGQSATRMGCSKNGKCYMLFGDNQDLVNRATIVPPNTVTQNGAKQVLLEIDPLTNTVTEIGSLIDVPGNTVSVDALAGGDIMFDDSDKAYVIDNNGQFFKINISTFEGTYLSLMNGIAGVVPAGLAYSVLGNPYYFSAAGTSPRNIAEIDLITNTATVRTSVPTQMGDAFSCAFPVLTSQPNMPKSFYKIVGADVNGLGGNRELSSEIIPGDIIEFEIVIRNIGKLPLLNTRFYDNIPAGSSYILGTSKVNGIILSDTGGTSPFVSGALIQSPNAITGRVLVDTTPNIIDREAVIQLRVRIDNPATTLRISNIGRLTAEDISQTYTYDPNGSGSNSFSDVLFEQLPIAVNDYYSTPLNTPVDLNPLSGDIGENTGPLSIIKINGIDLTPGVAQTITVPNGSVEISSTGIITYIPTTGFIGTTSFPYTVSSTLGETRTAYQFITVPNTPPVAITDMYTGAGNSAITLNPLSGDYDTDNHALTIISINGETLLTGIIQLIAVSGGVVTVGTSGIITFTPDFGFTGIVSFPYVIIDEYGGTGTANQIINLSNQDPIAIDDNYSTTVNTPIGLNPLSGDTDPDGNNLIISSINGVTLTPGVAQSIAVSSGTVLVSSTGLITFVPSTGFVGIVSFPYIISDGNGGTATATETITITNNDPIAVNDNYSTPANTPIGLNPLSGDTDPDGHSLSITSINGVTLTPGVAQSIAVSSGTVLVSSTGLITFVPSTGFVGIVSFPYIISDGNGGTATATETITITNNDPIAVNDNYSTPANTPIGLNPLSGDTDPDGHSLSITSINGVTLTPGVAQSIAVSSGTVLVSSTGLITFVPSTGFVGIVSFPYIISDGNGGTATATETITITNNDPIAVNDNYSTPANTPIGLNPLSGDTDPDGHSLSITSINGVTLTPGVAQSIAVSSGTVLVSSTGLITFVPSTGFVGIVSFPYIISDGNGGTTTATETITITNNDPIALDDSATTPANIPVVLNLLGNDTDPDGHTLSITSINGVTLTSGVAQSILIPNGIVTVNSTGVVTFIPDPLYTGPTGFPYTISDGNGGTDTANVSIDVLNTDPVAVDNYYTGAIGANILLQPLVNDSDVDGHNLNITDINGVTLTPGVAQSIPVTGGVVTIDIAGNITFTPNPGFTGGVAIPYSISDGHGGSDNATIFINYPNNPPVASNDTGSTIAGTPIIISPLGNDTDPDGNPLTITEINGVPVIPGSTVTIPGGTATLNPDGTITFTPNPGFTGDVVIPYTISDGNGGTDTATISISVTSDPIAANDDNYTTQTNTPVVINLLNNDVSPLGDDLTITSINGITLTPGIAQSIPVTGGIVNISPAGITTFVPDTGFAGVVTFPYSIIDEFGNTDTALVTITVENTPPVANNDIISTLVNTPVIIYPLTNDSDPDGNPLTITEINGVPVTSGTTVVVTGGTATLNPDGTITFTPNPGFTGDVVIPYTISDGNGGTDTAVITVTVETAPLAANPDLYTSNPNQNIDLNILANDVSSGTITITDINGVTLTPGVAQTIPVSGGVVNVSSTGLIAFTPNPGFVGPVSFPYTITDTLGNTDDTTVQINILNSGPIALDDSATTPANIPVVLNLLDNDTDPDGHTLSITSINGVTLTSGVALSILVPNGIVTVSSTGVITFIPDPLYTGPTGFPYTISDGNGGTDTANVSIDVLNTDPVAVDNYYTGAVGANILLQPLVNDSDVDGHNLNITDINGVTLTPGIAQTIPVTGGVVTIDIAGNITFTPNPGFTGGVAIPYSISDGHGGSDNATIFINYPNNPPVASNDTGSTIAGTPIIISPLGNDTDPDGNPLTITEINGVPVIPGSTVTIPGGTATLNPDGTITFTPNPGFTGDVVIPYTISDGNGGTDTAIISISVTSDPIAANDDNYTTQTNTPVVINLLNNDVSPLGDDLTITSINGITLTPGIAQSIPVTGGIVNISPAGITTFVPDTGFAGVVTFPYSIIDEFGNTDTALVTITVENTPPVANNDIISTLVNTPVIIYPLTNDSDPDGNPLTITEINGVPVTSGTTVVVTGGTTTLNPDGTITFTPNPGFTGDVVIPYTISDGNGGTNTAVITVTVETAPLAANPDLYTSNPNQNIDLNILANDVSSGTITITDINGVTLTPGVAQTIPVSGGVVNVSSTGLIAFTPNPGFVGPISFPYTITDTLGNTDDTTVQINILNSDPIALDDSATTPANIPVVLNLLDNDTDPDGHTLSITSINGVTLTSGVALSILVPNGIVTVSSTGVITFIPDPLYTGPTGFPYTISDGNGGTDTANVSIDVLNTDPVAVDNYYTGAVGANILLQPLVNDSDVDGHNLNITDINGVTLTPGIAQTIPVTGGVVTIDIAGNITFTPNPGFTGGVAIPYSISDGHGGSDNATIFINYPNNPPVASNDTGSTIAGTPIIISPLGNDTDPDGNPLTITEINGVPVIPGSTVTIPGGTATLNPDGTITFTPNPGFTGDVVIPYTISDGNGGTDTAIISISVTSDPIAANDDNYTTQTNTPVVINLLNNDVSPLGDDLTITSINGITLTPGIAQSIPVTGGIVNISPAGITTFVPDTGFAGVVTFPYSIIDEFGNTDTALVTITVENTPPVANNDIISTLVNTPVIIYPLTNDSDPDGNPLTITEINGVPVTSGTTVVVTGGTATLNPDGTITFTPNPGFTGDVVIPYTISDGNGGTNTTVITVTVETAPLAANPDLYTSNPNQNIDLNILANDVSSGTITITDINGVTLTPGVAQTIPVSGGVVNVSSTGLIAFSPDPGFVGPVSFPYTITDTLGNTDDTTVQINILNSDPIALDGSATTPANIPVVLNLLGNDTDPDGHTLSITSINGVTLTSGVALSILVPNGIVTVSSTGVITFIPDPLYTGPTGFPYTISDGNGGTDTANVSIDVLNTDPVANPNVYSGVTNTQFIINPLSNDIDADNHSLSIVYINNNPITINQTIYVTGGKVILQSGGLLLFQSDSNYLGHVNFQYTINDGHGGQSTANIKVIISGDMGTSFSAKQSIENIPTPVNQTIETTKVKIEQITKILELSEQTHAVASNPDVTTINIGVTKILPKTGADY